MWSWPLAATWPRGNLDACHAVIVVFVDPQSMT
jgi:hypothetical protein